jgi:hypothetical protein
VGRRLSLALLGTSKAQVPGSVPGDLGLCRATCWCARTVSNRRHLLCKFEHRGFTALRDVGRTVVAGRSWLLLSGVVDVKPGCQGEAGASDIAKW